MEAWNTLIFYLPKTLSQQAKSAGGSSRCCEPSYYELFIGLQKIIRSAHAGILRRAVHKERFPPLNMPLPRKNAHQKETVYSAPVVDKWLSSTYAKMSVPGMKGPPATGDKQTISQGGGRGWGGWVDGYSSVASAQMPLASQKRSCVLNTNTSFALARRWFA